LPSPLANRNEHHIGGASRLVPLFPELLPYLREVFEEASPGDVYVITRYRASNCNLRTHLHHIIHRAGLKPWPKLFQNLRSTRETELAETYPLHVVCAWIGNSQAVAAKHYLQVTDEHFERAAGASETEVVAEKPVVAMPTMGDLEQLASQWAELPPGVQQQILGMIETGRAVETTGR